MYGPSDYDYSPGGDMYGPDGYDSYPSQGPKIDIKKYLPMIIGLGLLLVIGFVLLNYLGSQRTITIKLQDLDGKTVEGIIKLTDERENVIETFPAGKGRSFTATLFPGEYFLRVDSDGHESISRERISVSGDSKDPVIKLTRDLDATLTINLESNQMYSSQIVEGRLIIYNSGVPFNFSDIKANTTSPLEINIHPSPMLTEITGTAIIDFSMSVQNASAFTTETKSNLSFSIKGSTLESKKSEITIKPVVNTAKELTVLGTLITSTGANNVTAGEQSIFEITIQNKNKKTALEDLYLEIEPDLGYEDNLNWITIGSSDLVNGKYIPKIDPNGGNVKIGIYVKTNLNQKINDEFKGLLKITSLSLSDPYLSKTFILKVNKEREATLEFKMSEKFEIKCTDKGCSGMKNLINEITMTNNSKEVEVGPIEIKLNLNAQETTSNCQSFFVFDKKIIEKISPKETYKLIAAEIINPIESAGDETAVCVIEWTYNDPYDPTIKEKGQKAIRIEKTTR